MSSQTATAFLSDRYDDEPSEITLGADELALLAKLADGPIVIWAQEEAPEEIRWIFHPSDCDWIAYVPPRYSENARRSLFFLEEPHFGAMRVSVLSLPDGGELRASYHS